MAKDKTTVETAKAMWLRGESVAKISRELGIHRNTIQDWKRSGGWEKIKNALPDEAPPRRPQLVSFDGGQRQSRKQIEVPPMPDMNTAEGQLLLLDQMIHATMSQIVNPESPQMYAASLNGLTKLLAERRAVLPIGRMEYLKRIFDLFRDDEELLDFLYEQGFGTKSKDRGPKVTPINTRL
jgi:hypothetical protein